MSELELSGAILLLCSRRACFLILDSPSQLTGSDQRFSWRRACSSSKKAFTLYKDCEECGTCIGSDTIFANSENSLQQLHFWRKGGTNPAPLPNMHAPPHLVVPNNEHI